MDYNVVVIGAGSAGLVSAYICALLKAKVALIEKNKMGGDCLNTGCVPSKAFIRTATLLSHIRRHKEFGLASATAEFDFAQIMERVQRIIRQVAPHDSIERYTALGVKCIQGEAKLLSPNKVQVNGKILTAKNIILATGATPSIPKLPGLDKITYLDTETIWSLREQPKRLLILGGGPIGCELGQCFARLGTQVTLVQRGPQLLPREDEDTAKIVQERLVRESADLRLNTKALEITVRGNQKFLAVECEGKKSEVEFDQILVAVGRKPRVRGFGLEEIGVQISDKGMIATDEYSRTNIKNIFSCGDAASPYQFTHMAAHQAWYCAVNALFQPFKKFKVDLSIVPWCTFTDPEVARFGLNEKEAKEKNIPYEVTIYPLEDLDRAITEEENHGFVKILTNPGKDRILGVTVCGYHAGDLITEFLFAKKYGHPLNDILNTIHIYPTMGEANKYAAGLWKKNHAPKGLLNLVGGFNALRRL